MLFSVRRRLIFLVALITLPLLALPLHNDVRYEVGVHQVSVFSVAETFSHRPIAFRLLVGGQAWLARLFSDPIGAPGSLEHAWAFEIAFRFLAAVASAGAAFLLARGLAGRIGSVAWAYGLAAYAGLMFTAPATGEPDWWAAVLAVAAVGAGLFTTRVAVAGMVSGLLLAGVALMKVSTLPVALAALIVVWWLGRRVALIALVSAFVSGCLAIVLIWWLAPYEIRWLLDIRALQPAIWGPTTLTDLGTYLVNLAARWPVVGLLPAFFVGAPRRDVLAVGTAALGAVAGFVVQAQYFIYHAVPLVVLCAVLAVATLRRSNSLLRWLMVAWIAWTLVLFTLPGAWRTHDGHGLGWLTMAWVVALVVARAMTRRRPAGVSRAAGAAWAAGLVSLAMLATQTPWSADSLSLSTAGRTSVGNLAQLESGLTSAAQIRSLIGADTMVAYLAFGSVSYEVGNPTRCHYPSELFLQRPRADVLVSSATRQESLDCLTDPAARWLIWDKNWLKPRRMPADLRAIVADNWACEGARVIRGLTVCPRKG